MASSNENSPDKHCGVYTPPRNDDLPQYAEASNKRQLKEREDETTYEAKLRRIMVELSKNEEVKKVATVIALVSDDDDDDIAHDPEIRAMWKRGEHTCEMFDAPCAVCVKEKDKHDFSWNFQFIGHEICRFLRARGWEIRR